VNNAKPNSQARNSRRFPVLLVLQEKTFIGKNNKNGCGKLFPTAIAHSTKKHDLIHTKKPIERLEISSKIE